MKESMAKRIKYIVLVTVVSAVYFLVQFHERTTTINQVAASTTQQTRSVPLTKGKSDVARQKTLVIMTQTRSGSTFTGEIFAATNNSMYLYEPLYPYGIDCTLPAERKALLKQLLSCDFKDLREIYRNGFNISNWKFDGANCVRDGFCFTRKSRGLIESYKKACRNSSTETKTKCGFPLRHDVLQNVCMSSSLVVTKVNRICTLDEMDNVYQHLIASGNRDVYVLHMLRDVRSITSSRIKLAGIKKVKTIVDDILSHRCQRQRQNVVDKINHTQDYVMMTDRRYMRIRYEDLASNAVGAATKVFEFMGLPLPSEVEKNIKTNLHPNSSVIQKLMADKNIKKKNDYFSKEYKSAFGVVRDPIKVLNEWRNLVPFEYIEEIQEKCGDVLKEMGYIIFSSETELKDLSKPAFQTHLPKA